MRSLAGNDKDLSCPQCVFPPFIPLSSPIPILFLLFVSPDSEDGQRKIRGGSEEAKRRILGGKEEKQC